MKEVALIMMIALSASFASPVMADEEGDGCNYMEPREYPPECDKHYEEAMRINLLLEMLSLGLAELPGVRQPIRLTEEELVAAQNAYEGLKKELERQAEQNYKIAVPLNCYNIGIE